MTDENKDICPETPENPDLPETPEAAPEEPKEVVSWYIPQEPQGREVVSYYVQRDPMPQNVWQQAAKKEKRRSRLWLWISLAVLAVTVAAVVLAAILGGSSGSGQHRPLPDGDGDNPSSIVDIFGSKATSIPRIQGDPGVRLACRDPQGQPLTAQEVYAKVNPSVVTVVSEQSEGASIGTGVIMTSDGYIITNAHVVLNTKSVLVTVTTYDGQQYDAVVVGMDRTTDLAVIKTNDYGFTPAEFGDSDQLTIGEWVVAIGNPGGERFASSLTRGIVSGLDRAVERYSEEGMTYIQTDAAINPGNSGGPLVNMYGQVVGINSSKIITDGYEGMGFAIPVSKAKDIIDQLLSGGYVEGRVRLGISGYDLGEAEASFYGVPRGFMIVSIDEDSSFAGTEAQVNDIITAIDGEPVEDLQDISNLLLRYSPGDEITVTLYRLPENSLQGGEELEVTITLLEDKGETQK